MADTTQAPFAEFRYLNVAELGPLRRVPISSRHTVEGLFAGRHASPQRGQSVEFNDYRQYTPGDEPRDIDWKVYGRSDRLYVRIFEHQAEMGVHLLVDASASMGYRGSAAASGLRRPRRREAGPPSKYDHACRMAAAAAFLVTEQQDRVGFALAQQGLQRFMPRRGAFSHLHEMLLAMEKVRPWGKAGLASALEKLVPRLGRKGMLIVLSDLLDEREPVLKHLAALRQRGHDVVVFHVLHQDELELPHDLEQATFIDSESAGRLRVNVRDLRRDYEQRMRTFIDAWSAGLANLGIEHELASMAEPPIERLARYLLRRSMQIRPRG